LNLSLQVAMGVCTTSSFFCGFIIDDPELRSLAAVGNFWKNNETPIQEIPVTEVPREDVLELCESVDEWLRKSGRPFTAYSNF
jgi:hypothetical protein